MKYMSPLNQRVEVTDEFLGHYQRLKIDDRFFYDTGNLSSDYYPLVRTRAKKRYLRDFSITDDPYAASYDVVSGFCAHNKLAWVRNGFLVYDGEKQEYYGTSAAAQGRMRYGPEVTRTVVAMGAHLVIFPDKLMWNTTGETYHGGNYSWDILNRGRTFDQTYTFAANLTTYDKRWSTIPTTEPGTPSDGDLWQDGSGERPVLRRWSAQDKAWVSVADVYVRLKRTAGVVDDTHTFNGFYANDAVELSGFANDAFNGTFLVAARRSDSLLLKMDPDDLTADHKSTTKYTVDNLVDYDTTSSKYFILRNTPTAAELTYLSTVGNGLEINGVTYSIEAYSQKLNRVKINTALTLAADTVVHSTDGTADVTAIEVRRNVPDLDFICEWENRLWGVKKDVNEIYACALGDPTNWYRYEGISTDSYAVNVGSPGEWTGCIVYQGHPMFFKEDIVYVVYGSQPSNFQLSTIPCRGVAKGSDKSLCVVNGTLYYNSPFDICAFNGGYPQTISNALGYGKWHDVESGVLGRKIFFTMRADNGNLHTYTYDTEYGIWYRQNSQSISNYCAYGGDLFAVRGTSPKYLVSMSGSDKYLAAYTVDNTVSAATTASATFVLSDTPDADGVTYLSTADNKLNIGGKEYTISSYTSGTKTVTLTAAATLAAGTVVRSVHDQAYEEDDFEWFAMTGDIELTTPDHLYVSKIQLRVQLIGDNSNLNVRVRYDNEQEWTEVFNVQKPTKRELFVPIIPRRCQRMRIRLGGTGEMMLWTIAKTIEAGSELHNDTF